MSDLAWGLQMTVLGMGLVFGLLALLWGLLTLVQRYDNPPSPVAVPDVPVEAAAAVADEPLADASSDGAAPTVRVPATVQGMDAELVAAILVATLRHRAQRRREAAPETRIYWPGSLLYASRWVGAGRSRQNNSWQRRGK